MTWYHWRPPWRRDGIIAPHGGYETTESYRTTEIVYDATVVFCGRFIDRRSRTHDQMVQAARSGQQNQAEGSMVSGTSKKMELKLVGVARASLEELRRGLTLGSRRGSAPRPAGERVAPRAPRHGVNLAAPPQLGTMDNGPWTMDPNPRAWPSIGMRRKQ